MKQLEMMLNELLVKKAPFHLPENVKQGLVKILPWLVLLVGALTIIGAWGVFQAATTVDRWASLANELSATYGVGNYTNPVMTPLLWLSLIILLVEAVLYFAAYPALEKFQKKGWDILFWVALVNAVQGVVHNIAYATAYFNIGAVALSLLGSLVGLYLLFQIRAYYTGEKKLAATGSTMSVPKEAPAEKPAKPAVKPEVAPKDDTETKA